MSTLRYLIIALSSCGMLKNVPPRGIPRLISGSCEYYLICKKIFCRYD